ncbi:MAG: hypothetical protein QM722_17500 [Piscinibacter sp.]
MNTIDQQISASHGLRDDFYGIVCVAAFTLVCVFAVVPAQDRVPVAEQARVPTTTMPAAPAMQQVDESIPPTLAEITPAETVGAYEV